MYKHSFRFQTVYLYSRFFSPLSRVGSNDAVYPLQVRADPSVDPGIAARTPVTPRHQADQFKRAVWVLHSQGSTGVTLEPLDNDRYS